MMTDEEAADKMKKICAGADPEIEHYQGDEFLCELLTSLGYAETVKAFLAGDIGYA